MRPSDLAALLARHGIRPLKARGQHFLLDDRVVAAMVEEAALAPGERVLEIGPGPGILTEALLAAGAQVVAVEIDRRLCALLRERFGDALTLVEGDVRRVSNAELASRFRSGAARGYKVVANLPYAITAEALQKFLLESPAPSDIVVMVQREVADRVLARTGDMSSLAVLVQTLATARRVVNVPRGAFMPPPAVDSAVIHISVRSGRDREAFFADIGFDRYFSIVRAAFAEPRKQLKNTLRRFAADAVALEKAFSEAKIRPQSRPEELGVEAWRRLALALTP